ncbi:MULTISPECIES: ABC transporter permease [unclassified Rathayibacter]|jgi:oligopeptide transport system permease protein|uniref:ABC transporter permease n=1 Tax=unclassified Rathayibacter TaxID=2609250 RepID=UPI000CE86935|nr:MULTISPECIES: ABC transporter permease [unclassified Rathayibacter]PPF12772.1 ABC transporter permease [Rathayibacter sp. AY1A5]PPF20274.1 ABC transporter permease [Rathayibacter sp. AY1A4]PPF22437.1 ABC transporter permease [Rathayibacter sp. AY1A7]PPF30194.1 ABC transporter permease [Rathayibacter sp. AY1F2]PPF40808.1 ABC transporter permease [Rathayibacter sp. AY1A3]
MLAYIVRRILQAVPVLIGTTFLIYFMVFSMPGNPLLSLFGDKTPSPALLARLEEQYHLNEPFFVQYLYYLGGVVRGDFGISFSGQSVNEILARTFPVTLTLAMMAIVIEIVVALTIGLISGLRKGSFFDASALVVSLLLVSVPIFVLCFIAQSFFAIQLGWFPPTVGADASFQRLLLPAIVLALFVVASAIRLTRGSVIETAGSDFVRTAYSKGLSRRRVIPVHVLRNSLIPVTTQFGADFGLLIVGATVTEGIFNVPGVGNTLYQAIIRGERPTVVSFVTVMVLFYLVVNILVDLLYAVLDPRIRYAK